ncbi:hypothetical protein COL5a_007646 [Colletotrichum fioriniae]|nr:hypothetical protein COL5a_007646 [Colletotrichum fioriniae]
MVAKFEGATATPEKSDRMSDRGDFDLTPSSSPVADKGKGKASFDEPTDTAVASVATGDASQTEKKKSAREITDLELLKMEDYFNDESLTRSLDNYIAPKHIHTKVKVLPLEEDEGVSMVKAAKIELWNKLASLNEAFEKRHPSAKEERLAQEAAFAATNARLDEIFGESSKQGALNEEAKRTTRAERRAEQKAQKKADKKAQKARKGEVPVATAPQAVPSPTLEEHTTKEASLREKYPEIYAKIDYWRALGAAKKPADLLDPADSGSEYTDDAHSDDDSLLAAPSHRVAHETQTTIAYGQAAESKSQTKEAYTDDSSSDDDASSTGSSNGDPFHLNKYLTPEYQAKAQAYLKAFDEAQAQTQAQATDKPVYGPAPPPSSAQSGGKTIAGKPTATDKRSQKTMESDDNARTSLHVSDDELSDTDDVKAAKVSAAQQERDEINRRAYERVNAAHARGEIVHLENTKPIRDTFSTDIKKEDIVPGIRKGKNKQALAAFDEEAYADRSIASHTMKPAPLRIPSRAKQPTVDSKKTSTKDVSQAQSNTPTVSDTPRSSNSSRYRMVAGESTSLTQAYNGNNPFLNRTTSGSSTQSGGPRSSGGTRNFSWPKRAKNSKYDFVDSDDDEAIKKKKKSDKTPAQTQTTTSGGSSSPTTLLNNINCLTDFTRKMAPLPKPPVDEETGGRRGFTVEEYKTVIQDEFNRFVQQSPEKKARDLETALAILNGVPSASSSSGRAPTTPAPAASDNITRQTVTVNPFQQHPAVRLAGATALPPTPATSVVPATTSQQIADLDDFLAEENDNRYTTSGPAAAGSSYASSYNSTASTSQKNQNEKENQDKYEPWNDPNYHEEALSHGYAFKQTGYNNLPDDMDPVPLTRGQRREVLEHYGMTEADYPAPPAGYPNPPGPEPGTVAPPCPSRPAPSVPGQVTPAGSIGGGSSTSSIHGGYSDAFALAQAYTQAQAPATAQSLRTPRRFRRAATAPPATAPDSPAPDSPAPGYDADWF